MSFRLTTGPFLSGDKDVTRRLGWANLNPDEHFMGIRQAQGLKKGAKVERLGECVCLRNEPEELRDIIKRPIRRILDPSIWCKNLQKCQHYRRDDRRFCPQGCLNPARFHLLDTDTPCVFSQCPGFLQETAREGFPELSPVEFVEMFCKANKRQGVTPETVVNRIEFGRVDP